jgi:hypothetical protein
MFVAHGFAVSAEQDPVQHAEDIGMVFAARQRPNGCVGF